MYRFANYDKFIMDCFNCMEISNATTEPRNWNEADAEVSHDIGQYKRWTNSPFRNNCSIWATQRSTSHTVERSILETRRRNCAASVEEKQLISPLWANTNVHRQFKSIEKERTCFVLNSRIGDMLKNIENHEFTLSPSIDNGKLLKANAPTVSCFGHNLANYAAFIGDIVCIELVSGISHMTLPKWSVSPLNEREE